MLAGKKEKYLLLDVLVTDLDISARCLSRPLRGMPSSARVQSYPDGPLHGAKVKNNRPGRAPIPHTLAVCQPYAGSALPRVR